MNDKKVWLVTGCSKGMGLSLVKELLSQGYKVVATSRTKESLVDAFGEETDNFYPVSLNVKDENDVKKVLEETISKFGKIDVVVNNAGFTHLATIEEMSDKDVRDLFDVNVFGVLNVIRNVLPIMRNQGNGHIFNVSSLGAYNVGPLSGIYCASKHAINAISQTLAMEVKDFNIKVTDVKPGFIRTEFFGKSYKTTTDENTPYKKLYDENMEFYMNENGIQPGSPEKVAKLYIKIAEMDNPPVSLPMGSDSVEGIKEICSNVVKTMDELKDLASEVNY